MNLVAQLVLFATKHALLLPFGAEEEAAWFIKVVMFFGSISGVIISIPCGVFLTMYWAPWRVFFSTKPDFFSDWPSGTLRMTDQK